MSDTCRSKVKPAAGPKWSPTSSALPIVSKKVDHYEKYAKLESSFDTALHTVHNGRRSCSQPARQVISDSVWGQVVPRPPCPIFMSYAVMQDMQLYTQSRLQLWQSAIATCTDEL